jgi:hypothetical protein
MPVTVIVHPSFLVHYLSVHENESNTTVQDVLNCPEFHNIVEKNAVAAEILANAHNLFLFYKRQVDEAHAAGEQLFIITKPNGAQNLRASQVESIVKRDVPQQIAEKIWEHASKFQQKLAEYAMEKYGREVSHFVRPEKVGELLAEKGVDRAEEIKFIGEFIGSCVSDAHEIARDEDGFRNAVLVLEKCLASDLNAGYKP